MKWFEKDIINDPSYRHVLGISGGKDSAALAIYIRDHYPKISDKMEYFFADTGAELKEFHSGRITEGESSRGILFETVTNADGTSRFKNENGFIDDGKWWIEGNTRCIQWERIRNGKPGCSEMYDLGGGEYISKQVKGPSLGTEWNFSYKGGKRYSIKEVW